MPLSSTEWNALPPAHMVCTSWALWSAGNALYKTTRARNRSWSCRQHRRQSLPPQSPHVIPLVRTEHVLGHREENALLLLDVRRQHARDRRGCVAEILLPAATEAGFEGRDRLLELELELAEDRVLLHQHRDRTRSAVDVPAQHREERLLLFTKVAQNLSLDLASQLTEVIEDASALHALALHSPHAARQLRQHRFGPTMLAQELFHDRLHNGQPPMVTL